MFTFVDISCRILRKLRILQDMRCEKVMKPKYTLTIKDNETGTNLLELDVEKTSLSYSKKQNLQVYRSNGNQHSSIGSGIKVDIQAEGFLPTKEEVVSTFSLDLDDDIEEALCLHEWETYLGLAFADSTCKLCGAKNK